MRGGFHHSVFPADVVRGDGNIEAISNLTNDIQVREGGLDHNEVSAFFDLGNVFSTCCVKFVGIDRVTPVGYNFSYNQLKRSVGIAVQWLAPLGIFRFSYAVPLNAFAGDGIRYPDQREGFQFSIGSAF